MNTNFPDFNSYEQDQFDFSPIAPVDQPTTPQIKTSEMERFWGVTGNWGEFGLYFGLGLSASLMVRAIPVFQPSALILIPAVGLGLVALSFAAPSENRVRYQVLLVAITAAIIGGNWDGWMAWLIANTWKIGASMVLLGTAIHLVPLAGGRKHG
ncbi:hypothetical protein [Microseira sp. BLCC-F43]|jgi:hypothetical protein|uniref:hypothetical protein n=1 Tax=Microseira sp. BLCC-F43 TaxID=3153602 RepID=UPI0035B96974